jgi:CRISPR/Cas system-associated exonuclease Cas4 (RecB family)
VLVAEEKPLRNAEYNIRGNADAIINLEGEQLLIDFKTIKDYPFTLLVEGEKELDRGYLYQMNIYLWLLNLKKGFFVFENKDTQEFHLEQVNFDKSIIEDVKKRISIIKEALDKKVAPDREFVQEDWHCKYCVYAEVCYATTVSK